MNLYDELNADNVTADVKALWRASQLRPRSNADFAFLFKKKALIITTIYCLTEY